MIEELLEITVLIVFILELYALNRHSKIDHRIELASGLLASL
jgi:hypothetical protein